MPEFERGPSESEGVEDLQKTNILTPKEKLTPREKIERNYDTRIGQLNWALDQIRDHFEAKLGGKAKRDAFFNEFKNYVSYMIMQRHRFKEEMKKNPAEDGEASFEQTIPPKDDFKKLINEAVKKEEVIEEDRLAQLKKMNLLDTVVVVESALKKAEQHPLIEEAMDDLDDVSGARHPEKPGILVKQGHHLSEEHVMEKLLPKNAKTSEKFDYFMKILHSI